MDKAKYKKIFMEEARDHLKDLADGFVLLERNPDDLDCIDDLFRHAHSMKGMASSMGYETVASLSHAMEDVLDLVKKRELKVDSDVIDLLLSSLDRIEKMVDEADKEDRISIRSDDLVEKLRGMVRLEKGPIEELEEKDLQEVSPEELVPVEVELEPAGQTKQPLPARAGTLIAGLGRGRRKMLEEFLNSDLRPYYLEVILDMETPAPSARIFIILNRLSKAGVIINSVPEMDEVKKGASSDRIEALFLFAGSEAELTRMVESIPDVQQVRAQSLDPGSFAEKTEADKEAVPEKPSPKPKLLEMVKKSQTVRVDTIILDNLINIVGELLISQERLNMVVSVDDKEGLLNEISVLKSLIHQFQETIMEVRMMPLNFVAGRFPRMIRDLSHRSGKEIVFEVSGLEIELDRAVLEDVGEVLVHILRNCVDHGMETPSEREKSGKKKEGRISFRAYRERDWVFIQISDDGKGIDLDAVRAKAMEVGLVGRETLEKMDQEEIIMLTTAPGFSTAKEVTDVSGRGVGLDAVRAKVESLGGNIAIYSNQGKGTTVTMKIPLSLAVVQILVVGVDDQHYGIPVTRIHHTVDLATDMIKKTDNQEYFKDGRSLVRLQRLKNLLGIKKRGPARRSGPVVVVEKGRRKLGFLVDELLGTRDAVIKPIGQPMMRVPALAGATILGDGNPMFILDILHLL